MLSSVVWILFVAAPIVPWPNLALGAENSTCHDARTQADRTLEQLEAAEEAGAKIERSLGEIARSISGIVLNSTGNGELEASVQRLENEARALTEQAHLIKTIRKSASLTSPQRQALDLEIKGLKTQTEVFAAQARKLRTETPSKAEVSLLYQNIDQLAQINALGQAIEEAEFARTALYVEGPCSPRKSLDSDTDERLRSQSTVEESQEPQIFPIATTIPSKLFPGQEVK